MTRTFTETELVRGCKKGVSKHQQALYKTYYRRMYGLCLRYTDHSQDAEDVLQEGFIKIFTKIGKFREEGSLEGWIRRIMIRTAIEHYRKNSRFFSVVDVEEASDVSLDEDMIGRMQAEELLKMIRKLPPGYRTVFNLYEIEGYSHKEISEMLGISSGTSKSQLSRAKELLRNQLSHMNIGRHAG